MSAAKSYLIQLTRKALVTLLRPLPSYCHRLLPERLYRHLHFVGPVTIPLGKNRAFRTQHYGFQVENDLFWGGCGDSWEPTSLRLWAYLCRKATRIVDVGANTGIYTLMAKTLNPEAEVIALEPVQRVFEKLQHNIMLNGFVIEALPLAVSAEVGTATLYDTPNKHQYSASLESNMLAGRDDLIETTIETTTLDDLFVNRSIDDITLIKIDTERHEVEVFKGSQKVLSEHRPIIIVEILSKEIGSTIESMLADSNYCFFSIDEGKTVRQTDHLGECDRNYLLCPAEYLDFLGLTAGELSHTALSIDYG